MRRVAEILLTLVALGEIAVGALLILFPGAVIEFLLGAPLEGAGIVIARMAGIGIVALGLGWWADRNRLDGPRLRQVAVAFVGYNVGVGLLLLAYAWGVDWSVPLAWLVGIVHLLAGLAFAVAAYRAPSTATAG